MRRIFGFRFERCLVFYSCISRDSEEEKYEQQNIYFLTGSGMFSGWLHDKIKAQKEVERGQNIWMRTRQRVEGEWMTDGGRNERQGDKTGAERRRGGGQVVNFRVGISEAAEPPGSAGLVLDVHIKQSEGWGRRRRTGGGRGSWGLAAPVVLVQLTPCFCWKCFCLCTFRDQTEGHGEKLQQQHH